MDDRDVSNRDAPAQAPSAQSVGVRARGRYEDAAQGLTGRRGINHWVESRISRPGLDERGSVFFAAVEMTRMPMIVTDPSVADNPVVFANGAFLDLTGYEEDEILGRNCRFLQGARTDRDTVAQIREALAARRPFATEILNYRRDGTPFWNALFIGPIYDNDGRLIYFFASQLDITRRRASEDAFRQSQKMEAIGQLTAGLAHDFNNILQIVIGNLELAQLRLESGSAASNAIARADRGARQAAKVTGQLLAFARKTRLEPRPTNLNTLITEFGEMVARTLGAQISIDLDLELALPHCVVDPGQVEMALLNVLVNARDAMPEGGTVTIGTKAIGLGAAEAAALGGDLAAGRYVELAVADQGQGMEPDILDRAIEPFFTTKGPGRGTGLGLAMVHGFLRQSGGALAIDSKPGRGTSIRMLFPEQAAASAAVAEEVRSSDHDAGGSETVLVVDDSAEVLEIATGVLGELGYDVLCADCGETALEVLKAAVAAGRQIDLLFTDIVMPGGINGIVLAERARALIPDLKLLLATGYIEDLVAQGPRARGMDVLGKPYRRAELARRVREALEHPHRAVRTDRRRPQSHKEA